MLTGWILTWNLSSFEQSFCDILQGTSSLPHSRCTLEPAGLSASSRFLAQTHAASSCWCAGWQIISEIHKQKQNFFLQMRASRQRCSLKVLESPGKIYNSQQILKRQSAREGRKLKPSFLKFQWDCITIYDNMLFLVLQRTLLKII